MTDDITAAQRLALAQKAISHAYEITTLACRSISGYPEEDQQLLPALGAAENLIREAIKQLDCGDDLAPGTDFALYQALGLAALYSMLASAKAGGTKNEEGIDVPALLPLAADHSWNLLETTTSLVPSEPAIAA